MCEIQNQQNSGAGWLLKNGNPGLDLRTLPRCQATAKTTGKRCKNPAMKGSNLCCVHKGLYKPSAPFGNKNAMKHGFYSKRFKAELRETRNLIDDIAKLNITNL